MNSILGGGEIASVKQQYIFCGVADGIRALASGACGFLIDKGPAERHTRIVDVQAKLMQR